MAVVPILSAIGSLASGVGSWFGASSARKQSERNLKRQLAFEREEAEKQRQWNLSMWEKENQYNSPKEQMARLSAAGLNPNLAYGSGNVAGLSSSTVKGYQKPSADFSQVLPPAWPKALSSMSSALMAYQNFKLAHANAEKAKLDVWYKQIGQAFEQQRLFNKQVYEAQRAKKMSKENVISHWKAKVSSELYKTQVDAMKARVNQIKETTRGITLENDLNALLKPYGLTTRDNVWLRQIVRMLQRDNPGISAIEVMQLLPNLGFNFDK